MRPPSLQNLVLHEGDRAVADGRLISSDRGLHLLPEGGYLRLHKGVLQEASGLVELRLPAIPPGELDQYDGRHLQVTGRWLHAALHVDNLAHLVVHNKALASPPRQEQERPLLRKRRPEREAALFANGVLLDVWDRRDASGEGSVLAITESPDVARSELYPLYGDHLVIVESRWSNSLLLRLETVLASMKQPPVVSLGRHQDGDGQLSVSATLLYASSSLLEALAPYPEEALKLSIVLRPAARGRMTSLDVV